MAALAVLEAEARKRNLSLEGESACLWPAPYNEPSFENAYAFLLLNRTWNEAEGELQLIPDRDYIRRYAQEWWSAYSDGRVLCIEKCRRMVISWVARALTLYVMGLSRTDVLIGGEDYEASAKHCWRYEHLYADLRKRLPAWKLPAHTKLKFRGEKQLSNFALPNGSTATILNGQPDSVQGEGVRIVDLEEFGIYSNPQGMLAQARIIVSGSGSRKGFVNLITNSSVNADWQFIKRGGLDESQNPTFDTLMEGFEAALLPTGMRMLKLHHNADPEKDGRWLADVQRDMQDTPRDFRLQILMDDREDYDALWSFSDIDPYRVDVAGLPDMARVIISVDPAAKGDKPGMDETGIIVHGCAVRGEGKDRELHCYVIADASGQHSPAKTAELVVKLEQRFGAAEIVYEENQGGDWIAALIETEYQRQQIHLHAPFIGISVHEGKALRAEPIAAKYRQGFVHHVVSPNSLAKLESQLTRWNPLAGMPSPGRLDANTLGLKRLFSLGLPSDGNSSSGFKGLGTKR